MKATSKIISVVLILALCLSIFTVSAFAQEPVIIVGDTLDLTGGEAVEVEAVITGNTPAAAVANAPADDSVKVADFAGLAAALEKKAPVITLTAKVPVAGPLTLDYAVKLNLGGKGCGLDFSGSGDAAIVSTVAGAEISNGNLFVTDASSVDKDGKAIGGFLKVAEGNVKMVGVHIWNFGGEGSVFGEGVNFVSGTSSKALHANDVAVDGRFVYEVKTETAAVDQVIEAADAITETGTADAETVGTDPVNAETTDAESSGVESIEAAPADAETTDAEAATIETADAESIEAAPADAESTDAEVADTEATDAESAEAAPADAETTDAEAATIETADAESTEAAPADAEATDAETADTESANTDAENSFANEEPVNVVKEEKEPLKDELRMDEAALQAIEEEKTTLTATDEVTGAVITVTGFLPEGLSLVVEHIDTSRVGGLAEGEVALLAVDITLVDAEGNKYEPVNNPDANFRAVTVTISHPSLAGIAEDETLILYHVEETGTTQVASATAAEGSDTMSFSTGSLSPFIIAVAKGPGTANTGSDGEVHKRVIKINNLTGENYVKGTGGMTFRIEGGAAPESISIIDPDNVSSGNLDVYKAGYLIYGPLLVGGDYVMSNFDSTTGTVVDTTQPVDVTIFDEAVANAPTGKWAVVFWFKDTTDSGSTRVYMVQYVNIVPQAVIKGIGYNYDETTKTFEVEMCDYDSLNVLLTADLYSFTITRGSVTYASYNRDISTKKMMVRIDGKDKEVNVSEYFTVSDYYAQDALNHEFVLGKSLKIHDALIKKLGSGEGFQLTVTQRNKQAPLNEATETFRLNIFPGITVADGLIDYIKGRNTWIKFVSCAPIDYDSDGTLAIWIGGQKISHQYYSISNDHCTLWIYRNLLDQLKSNNSYTLTARLWEYTRDPVTGEKVKTTYYPATASFNILAAGSTSYRSPKTGDESNIALWAAVLLLSGGAVIALVPRKKKSK